MLPNKPPTHDPKGRTPQERLAERRASHDRRRGDNKPWRTWYSLARWRELRAFILRRDPACRICKFEGRLTPSCIADHVRAHEGDPVLFWTPSNVWGLCKTCHDSTKQRVERALASGSKQVVSTLNEWLTTVYDSTNTN